MEKARNDRIYLLSFLLLVVPYYLNDFANIFIRDWRLWLLIDYVVMKLLPILGICWLLRKRIMVPAEFGWTRQKWRPLCGTFIVVGLVTTLIDQNAYRLIAEWPGYKPLGGFPGITSPLWNWIDLTLGLFMVGIVEETIFRGYMQTFLSRYIRSPWAIVAISAVLFGLIHWSLGLHAILITGLIGAIFMAAYLKTRSLPAIMLAHFALNFIDFSGVIPKAIFQLD